MPCHLSQTITLFLGQVFLITLPKYSDEVKRHDFAVKVVN